MFKIMRNGNIVKEIVITRLPKWETIKEVRELVFDDYSKALDVSNALKGEVIEVVDEVEIKKAA